MSLLAWAGLARAQTVLLGDQAIESNLDSNAVGMAESFPVTATASGQVTSINFFLDESSTATKVYLGIYSDASGKPGSLLAQGNTTQLFPGTWNSVSLTATNVTSGAAYWIAILGASGGKAYFYDQNTSACNSQTSSQSNLTSLPSTWSKGRSWNTCYISAYAVSGSVQATVTIGDQVTESGIDNNSAGEAEAFPAIANATGNVSSISVYIDPTSGSGPVNIGLYADNGHNHPGTLLGQGSIATAVPGSWNQISIAASSVTAGGRYWIAILGQQSNSPYFRDRQTTACRSETSAQTNLASLPTTWSTGTRWNTCYLSAYSSGMFVPPTISASALPSPNPSGWNNSAVTVTFTCTAGSYPIQTCQSPISVNTDGADQAVTGTVLDTAGNTATATVTLNVDLTPPILNISSPANGAVLTASPASVSGSVSDSLSGLASVTCNGTAAAVQSGSYSCTVPLSAGSNTISVQATDVAGNTSSQSLSVTLSSGPVIGGFSPSSASVGTLVTITGSGFTNNGSSSPAVTLNQQGGGTILAPISSASDTSISFVIPTGAATGPITITTNGQSISSTNSLTVVAASSFTLAADPDSVTLLPGQTTTIQVSLGSTDGFTQLASLNVNGLPSGVSASFQPPQITAGQYSILTLSAPSTQTASASQLTISASAVVQGIQQSQSASFGLTVEVPGGATFEGRVAVTDAYDTPLAGVTVAFTGKNYTGASTGCTASTTTDAAGNFVLSGLPDACSGSQMIEYDPSTISAPQGKYSGVTLSYVLTPGQVTTPGIVVHLPRVDNAETVMVQQNSSTDQTFTFNSIPGVSITVYAGTTFSLADGSQPNPFPLSVVEIPYDKLPEKMPGDPTEDPIFAMSIEPENSSSSQPVAVVFPNRSNTAPGTTMPLTSLNPTLGMMVNYGTGTVSSDGRLVVPDPDPAYPGHSYGISHFDWHFFSPPPRPTRNPSPNPGNPGGGDPVDLASGLLDVKKTDLAFGGSRGQITLTRMYRSQALVPGPFGLGTSDNYEYFLDTTNASVTPGVLGLINLNTPDGNQLPFSQQQDGTYINTSQPSLAGAVISSPSTGVYNLRWKDSSIFQFQGSGTTVYLGAIIDSNGNATTIARSGGFISKVTDPVGRSITVALTDTFENGYGLGNVISSVTDPLGRTVRYTYNPLGLLASVTDAAGGVTYYDYDANNNLISIRDARGITYLQNSYNSQGQVIKQVAADGGVTLFSYSQLNDAAANSPVNETVVTDPLGNNTTYDFNAAGFLVSKTDALGEQTVYDVDPTTNQTLSVTDPLGRLTTYTYDSLGNMTSVTRLAIPPGQTVVGPRLGPATTSFTYDPAFNKVATITDPLGHQTTFNYDPANGNLLNITDPLTHKTQFTYDNFGEMVTSTDPLGNTTHFSYQNGDLLSSTDPLQRTTTRVTDAASRLVSVTDPAGLTTQYQYDALNQITQITDAGGHRTIFNYDPNGNLLSLTDANQHTTNYTYDPMDRVATRTDPLGHSESYEYDLNGNLAKFTDRRGKVSAYTYDPLNRRVTGDFGPGESAIQYSYDAAGRLVSATDSITGTITRGYDGLDRLTSEATPEGNVNYSYDLAGRRTGMQASGQSPTAYTYDDANRLFQISQGHSTVVFAYDDDGRRTSVTLPNGVVMSYGYDAASQLSGITYQDGNTQLGNLTYTYDLSGRRTATGGSFARTNVPQAITSESYNAANELTQFASSTYTYDADGDLISDGVNTYTWDARNRLTAIAGGVTASFRYDAFGRRVSKMIGRGTTGYLYDGGNPVQELVGGIPSANLLTGLNLDEYFQRNSDASSDNFLRDAVGSTVAVTDQSSAIRVQYTYSPFGNTTITGVSSNPYQFTGRENDTTDLYYYRARYYSPLSQRFISEDPVGFLGGNTNRYLYAFDNPVDVVDPSGRCPVCVIAGISGVIGGGVAGYEAYENGARGWNLAAAIAGGTGTGILAGLTGGVAGQWVSDAVAPALGLGLGTQTISGAAGGAAGGFVNSVGNGVLSGCFRARDIAKETAEGAAFGAVAVAAAPTVQGGENFNVISSTRTWGPRAQQAYTEAFTAGALGAAADLSGRKDSNDGCQ